MVENTLPLEEVCSAYFFFYMRGMFFCHVVLFKSHSPLNTELLQSFARACTELLAVDRIKIHLLGLTKVKYTHLVLLCPYSSGSGIYHFHTLKYFESIHDTYT